MMRSVRVLHFEANTGDFLAVKAQLALHDFSCELVQVADQKSFREQLESDSFDLILSDSIHASLDSLSPIMIAREKRPGTPLIVVADNLTEENAVGWLKSDVSDVVLKSNLWRLAFSMRRALKEIEERSRHERLEEALEKRNRELNDFLENANVGLHWVGADGRILWVNQAELNLLGYSREEYVGQHVAQFHADPNLVKDILQRLGGNEIRLSYEARLRCKDGSIKHVAISSNVLREGGKFVHTRCLTLDITERKRAEQQRAQALLREQEARAQAEAANRLKDQFLATLSHELRTPLTSILAWTRLLRSEPVDELAHQRALEIIEQSAKQQSRLIDDILDISRIISGKLRLEFQPIELVSVIGTAIETMRPEAEAKQIQIERELEPVEGTISGDPNRLQQIFWNLLSNAIKFTPAGGRVKVQLRRVDSQARVTVRDNGKGISPDLLPFIFDGFRQGDGSSTRTQRGLGLGLAIVRYLVEMQRGTVEARSEGEGKGAIFTVRFPLRIHREATPSRSSIMPLDGLPSLEGLKVLMVEDDPSTLELFSAILIHCGAEVVPAASAEEGLEAFKTLQPNVIVSDIAMPGQDGYSFIRSVRALESQGGGHVPAVALTSYARGEDRMASLRAGFQIHLTKPVEPSELTSVIASVTGYSTSKKVQGKIFSLK
jgi:PAS domain S-box-containing protein